MKRSPPIALILAFCLLAVAVGAAAGYGLGDRLMDLYVDPVSSCHQAGGEPRDGFCWPG